MSQKAFPRSHQRQEEKACEVIARHERVTGTPVGFPVPVELIVEETYGLEVLWDDIDEPSDVRILGALIPSEKRIVMNARHDELFVDVIGPERFTLAHELGHWLYDADDPDQLALSFDEISPELCLAPRAAESEDTRLRELNANNFAAHLLMPEYLVRAADVEEVLGAPRRTASEWGVSVQALSYRLDFLRLTGGPAGARLRFEP